MGALSWFTRARISSVPHRVSEAGMFASIAIVLLVLGARETMPLAWTLLLFFVAALCIGGGIHLWQAADTKGGLPAAVQIPKAPDKQEGGNDAQRQPERQFQQRPKRRHQHQYYFEAPPKLTFIPELGAEVASRYPEEQTYQSHWRRLAFGHWCRATI